MDTEKRLYFLGVSTGASFSAAMFPRWAEELGLAGARLCGVDMKIHDEPEKYREFVRRLMDDESCGGALITTHKLDLFSAAGNMFDHIDALAAEFREVSCIVKKNGQLFATATDPITSGMAMERFLPGDYFASNGAEVLIFGAGGSTLAICHALCGRGSDRPSRIVVTNRSPPRLEEARKKLEKYRGLTEFEYHLCPGSEENDMIMAGMKPCSLVVNATGLGKDRPGSPVSDSAVFPRHAIAWDLNYRGDLGFLRQAERQRSERGLSIEDGWEYFIIGWAVIVGMVYDTPMDGDRIKMLERTADKIRR